MTILEKIQALLGPTATGQRKHETLAALVEICKDEATQYCNLPEYTEKLDNAVVKMVLERYNKLNYDGLESSTASDITERFINGYSNDTMNMLRSNRKMKRIGGFDNGN
jgi:hypothetical protein